VDKRDQWGEDQKGLEGNFNPKAAIQAIGKSAKETTKMVGTSQAKVKRAREVTSDPKQKEALLAGEKTTYRAAQVRIMAGRRTGTGAGTGPKPEHATG
jgi:hypothetical protein